MVKGRIDVDCPEYLRVVYKRLRAMVESLNERVKSRLDFSQFTWQGLENVCIPCVLGALFGVCGCDCRFRAGYARFAI
jgi:hypothetical protein